MPTNGGAERIAEAEHAAHLVAAQNMTGWFSTYRFNPEEAPGPIPSLTAERLKDLLGDGDTVEQLGLLRTELAIFDEAHQPDLALYLCGFPDDTLRVLADDIDTTLTLLAERFPKVEPEPQPEKVVLEPVPAAVKTVGREAVRKTPKPAQKTKDEMYRLPGESDTDYRVRVQRMAVAAATRQAPQKSKATVSNTAPRRDSASNWFTDPVRIPGFPSRYPSERARKEDEDNPLAWQTDSLCAQTDPEAFFPEKGGSTRDAKKICASCEVRAHCLEYALENDERFGIWGGLSERERRKLRKQKNGNQDSEDDSSASSEKEDEKFVLAIRRDKRIDFFVDLVKGDATLRQLYDDKPRIMIQTAEALLDTAYPEADGEPLTDKRHQRLLNYFVARKWDKEDYDMVTEDLQDFMAAIEELRDEYSLLGLRIPFAQFYFDKYDESRLVGSALASA